MARSRSAPRLVLVATLLATLGAAPAAPPARMDFEFTDIDGKSAWLSDLRGHKALVVVVRDVGCPVSQRYGPRLARLEQSYAEKGVVFLYLNLNSADSLGGIRGEIAQFGFKGRYVHDPKGRIGRALRVRSTGDVFVLDSARTLAYRGPVDDQYGVGWTKPAPTVKYLEGALERTLAGRRPSPAKVDAPGCLLGYDRAPEVAARPITYHNRISRIVQSNCQTCHRTGGIAPFAMERYQDVYAKREMIAYMTKTRRMPPWFAHREVGEFANDRSLGDEDLRDLLAWIDAGAPEGNPRHAPKPRTWPTGWSIGTPDAVIAMPAPYTVPAEGIIDYQYFYVKTDFPEDRWIQRMELLPGARKHVHHALVFIEEPGRKWANDSTRRPDEPVAQGGAAGYFAGYAPGFQGQVYAPGTAKRLPKGAWLKFQMHYTANGAAAEDVTRLGFVWAKEPPTREVVTRSAANTRFAIPPHAGNHEVVGTHTLKEPGTVLSFFPHMHLRGKAFKVDVVGLDSAVTPVLAVPRYDFNWQLSYVLREPLVLPAGAKIRATAWFDNSTDNPYNPDPTKTVKHGPQSFDEMMIGYFDFIPAAPVASPGAPASPRR